MAAIRAKKSLMQINRWSPQVTSGVGRIKARSTHRDCPDGASRTWIDEQLRAANGQHHERRAVDLASADDFRRARPRPIAIMLGGCASVSPDAGMSAANDIAAAELREDVVKVRTEEDAIEARSNVATAQLCCLGRGSGSENPLR